MRLNDVIRMIEEVLPLSWAEEWDNAGLNVGNPSSCVSRIALALDVTEETVAQASSLGCQLLVTHHPVIFRPIKSVVADCPAMLAVSRAISDGVALYSAHTNWDSSSDGVNFCLSKAAGLERVEPLLPPQRDDGAWGLGAVGSFTGPVMMDELMRLLKERWRLSACAGWGDGSRPVTRAAIGGGSCGEMWKDALSAGADVFITADMSYHHIQNALGMGLNLIITDHGEMERVSLPALKSVIKRAVGLPVEILQESPAKMIFI